MVEMSKIHRKKKEKNEDLRLFILFTSHHIKRIHNTSH